jgi:hypothetical protein
MSWAWIGVACGSFVSICFIVMAYVSTPDGRVKSNLLTRFAAMQAGKNTKLSRLKPRVGGR